MSTPHARQDQHETTWILRHRTVKLAESRGEHAGFRASSRKVTASY